MVTQKFSLWIQRALVLLSPHSFKAHKNIPVLVGTTHRKREYLEMHRTYVLWFNFILGLNFVFLLFLGIVMYDNEFETMENKI